MKTYAVIAMFMINLLLVQSIYDFFDEKDKQGTPDDTYFKFSNVAVCLKEPEDNPEKPFSIKSDFGRTVVKAEVNLKNKSITRVATEKYFLRFKLIDNETATIKRLENLKKCTTDDSLVKLLDFRIFQSKVNNTKYYAALLEHTENKDLSSVIRSSYKNLTCTDVQTFYLKTAKTLAAFHSKCNLVHLDAKLENFIYDNNTKRLRLTEYDSSAEPKDSKILETPEFLLPPEIYARSLNKEPVEVYKEIDFYALGINFYRILVNKKPYLELSYPHQENKEIEPQKLDELDKVLNITNKFKNKIIKIQNETCSNTTIELFQNLIRSLTNPSKSSRLSFEEVIKRLGNKKKIMIQKRLSRRKRNNIKSKKQGSKKKDKMMKKKKRSSAK